MKFVLKNPKWGEVNSTLEVLRENDGKKRSQETARLFKPNLQKVSLKLNESVEQWKICTKCLKRIKKYKSIGDYKNIQVAI